MMAVLFSALLVLWAAALVLAFNLFGNELGTVVWGAGFLFFLIGTGLVFAKRNPPPKP